MLVLPGASSLSTQRASLSDLTLIKLPKVKVELKKSIFAERHSTNADDPVFSMKLKSGEKIVVYSDTCLTEGTVRCLVCSTLYDVRDNTGIIIGLKESNGVTMVETTKMTCSHNCSLCFLSEEMKKGRMMNSEYINSVGYHLVVYSQQYPDEPPIECPADRSLLRVFGGSMSVEEWHKKSYKLKRGPIMKVTVSKSSYS